MKIQDILLTSTVFMLMAIFLITLHWFNHKSMSKQNENENENENENQNEHFSGLKEIDIRDHSVSDFDNPEIPFSVTSNHFVLGGFCMQWGRTYSDEVFFHFPFDKVFIGYGTVAKWTNKWENIRVYTLKNDRMRFRYGFGDTYWLAIGLKINPINTLI